MRPFWNNPHDQNVAEVLSALRDQKEQHFNPTLGRRIVSTHHPKVVMPTDDHILRLGEGAVVAIWFRHRTDSKPFIVTLKKLIRYPFEYTSDRNGRMIQKLPMIYFDPINVNKDLITDDLEFCSAGHICAIFDFGKLRLRSRNMMFDLYNQESKITPVKWPKHWKNMRGVPDHIAHRNLERGHHDYDRSESTTRGVYRGDVFQLAKTIIFRRAMLDVYHHIDYFSFEHVFTTSRDTGLIPGSGDRRVNIKTFTKWVLRNYRKMMVPYKKIVKAYKESCRAQEARERTDYETWAV